MLKNRGGNKMESVTEGFKIRIKKRAERTMTGAEESKGNEDGGCE